MSHMIGKTTYPKSSYDRGGSKYGAKDPRGIVSGQAFNSLRGKVLDVTKTKMSSGAGRVGMFTAAQNKNTMMSPNRPAHQNAYKTVSGASLGKAPGWNTRGDNKKRALNRAYSMNHVSVARIMKGNVNANEGAYMKRGGDKQV